MHGCSLFPFQSISYFLYSYFYVGLDAQIQHKAIKQLNGFFYPKSLHDFCQQGCLSSHCWHRAVKSCLHGKLRSRKTDKPVSKKTTKVLNKEPFVRRLRVSAGRQTLIQVWSTHEPKAGREVIYLIHFPLSLCSFLSHACSLIFLFGYSPPTLYVFWLIFSLINISLEETLLQVINMSFSGPFKDLTEGLDWEKSCRLYRYQLTSHSVCL